MPTSPLCQGALRACPLALFIASLLPGARAQEAEAPPLVVARLLCDRASVAPGATFHVGVLFEIASDWHIYWRNPGASGAPTEVHWALPEGFVVGETRWPIPQDLEIEGIGTCFVYGGRVLLAAAVRAPEKIAHGPVTIRAEASWLACHDRCVLGSKDLELELPCDTRTPQASADAAMFRESGRRVPAPGHDLGGRAESRWRPSRRGSRSGTWEVTYDHARALDPAGAIRVLPFGATTLTFGAPKIARRPRGFDVAIDVTSHDAAHDLVETFPSPPAGLVAVFREQGPAPDAGASSAGSTRKGRPPGNQLTRAVSFAWPEAPKKNQYSRSPEGSSDKNQ